MKKTSNGSMTDVETDETFVKSEEQSNKHYRCHKTLKPGRSVINKSVHAFELPVVIQSYAFVRFMHYFERALFEREKYKDKEV